MRQAGDGIVNFSTNSARTDERGWVSLKRLLPAVADNLRNPLDPCDPRKKLVPSGTRWECHLTPLLAVFQRAGKLETVLGGYRGPGTIKGNDVQTIGVGIATFAEMEGDSTDELGA